MSKNRSFKQKIRSRMAVTGESYTVARRRLLEKPKEQFKEKFKFREPLEQPMEQFKEVDRADLRE